MSGLTHLGLKVTEQTKAKLRALAAADGRTLADYCRRVLVAHAERLVKRKKEATS